jgi:beta-lactamase regulating signal transducer with metallopeptidase domain
MVAMLWQSTLVAFLVAAAAFALRRSSPAVRYWLWQIVAIKLLILPLWSWSLALPWLPVGEMELAPRATSIERVAMTPVGESIPAAAPTTVPAATRVDRPNSHLADLTWRGWLFAAWGVLVLAQVGRLGAQRVRLSSLLRKAEPGDVHLAVMVSQVAARLKLKHAPRVMVIDLDYSPFVCGMARAVLVLPRELAATLSPSELHQVVAHELAHVQRRDLVWGWIPEIARTLFFFHPVAHLASYRIRLERELACDQLAMHDSGRGPGEYADLLVRVLSSASRPSIFRTSAAAPLDGGASDVRKAEGTP